jgi:hypothetical protein
MKRMIIGVNLLVVLVLAPNAFSQRKSAFVGTWELDVSRSVFTTTKVKALTLVISQESPKMFSWKGHGTDAEGKAFELAWSGAEDGSIHPTLQNGEKTKTDQGATKAHGSIHRHGKDPDGSFESTLTVSSDGKTLTDEINDTKGGSEKHVYRRVN